MLFLEYMYAYETMYMPAFRFLLNSSAIKIAHLNLLCHFAILTVASIGLFAIITETFQIFSAATA